MHVWIHDYEIVEMIKIARWMFRAYRNKCNSRPEFCTDPWPDDFEHYLVIKRIIKNMMQARRNHRAAEKEIWTAYVNSVLEARKKT